MGGADIGGAAGALGDGSLGIVEVDGGDAIQIRSLNTITGDVAFFGLPIDRAARIAVGDYGPIHGFDVELGTSLDGLCSNDGGQAAAQTIVADEDVVGVIGTSCSGAAVAAAPLITGAGMVLISGGNTSAAFTSDLAGNPGPNYSVGYYRTTTNDLHQGAAMAAFVVGELGLTTAAVIHDGDPYTQGLAQAFADAFEAAGGTITGLSAVNKDDTDMVPALTEIATGRTRSWRLAESGVNTTQVGGRTAGLWCAAMWEFCSAVLLAVSGAAAIPGFYDRWDTSDSKMFNQAA